MDPYVSVVPRLLPSQYPMKRIPMSDEGYQYGDSHPVSSYMTPSGNTNNHQTRMDFQENQSFYHNSMDKPFNGRTNNKGRFHHETLKDNNFDQYPTNSDYRSFDNNFKETESQGSINKSTKTIIIIFGIIIALFSLTALAISIYLLIKISNSSTTTSG